MNAKRLEDEPSVATRSREAPEGQDARARVHILGDSRPISHRVDRQRRRMSHGAPGALAGEVEHLAGAAAIGEETDAVLVAGRVRLREQGNSKYFAYSRSQARRTI